MTTAPTERTLLMPMSTLESQTRRYAVGIVLLLGVVLVSGPPFIHLDQTSLGVNS